MSKRKTIHAVSSLEVLNLRAVSEEKKRMYMLHTYFKLCDSPLFQYGILFILRKNSVKLNDLINKSKNKDIARDYIVWLKYLISCCNQDFVKVLVALAVDYENIKPTRDYRHALRYSSGYRYYHNETSFAFEMNESLYTTVLGYNVRFTLSEPYMFEDLVIDVHDARANESELYLLAGIMIAQERIKKNEQELQWDLSRRTGLENVMKKYAELEVKTDDEWGKENGSN